MKKSEVIVIGGEHYNTLGLIRSLGEKGININLILTTIGKNHISKSKYVTNQWITSDDADSIIDKMQIIASKHSDKLVVFPTSDKVMEILDQNYNLLSKKFFIPNIKNKEGLITNMMNKIHMNCVAYESGLNIPMSIEVKLDSRIQYIQIPGISNLFFPIILKPIASNSGMKEDIVVCKSEIDFNNAIKKLSNRYESILIQEYIHGSDQIMLEIIGCSYNNGESVVIPGVIEKIREYPLNAGSTSFAKLVKESKYIETNLVKNLISKIGYNGIFDVEFKYANGKTYFIEINFRNGAPGYAVTKAGVNLPCIWLNGVLGRNLTEVKEIKKDIYLMSELRDIRHVINRDIGIVNWLKDLARTDTFLYFNRKDTKPFKSKLFG